MNSLFRLTLVAILALAAFPIRSGAVPVYDDERLDAVTSEFVIRMMELQTVARESLAEQIERARTLWERTQELTLRREFEEEMKFGELAGLGTELPTWDEIKNECEGDVQREIICETAERVEDTMIGLFERLEREVEIRLFSASNEGEAETELDAPDLSIMDSPTLVRNTVIQNLFHGDLTTRYGAIERGARDRAHSAFVLDSLAAESDSLVDELLAMDTEELSEEVSSGRAMQIVAHMKIGEAQTALQLARSAASDLSIRSTEILDDMTRHNIGVDSRRRINQAF